MTVILSIFPETDKSNSFEIVKANMKLDKVTFHNET